MVTPDAPALGPGRHGQHAELRLARPGHLGQRGPRQHERDRAEHLPGRLVDGHQHLGHAGPGGDVGQVRLVRVAVRGLPVAPVRGDGQRTDRVVVGRLRRADDDLGHAR
jgi:hypothetical protein